MLQNVEDIISDMARRFGLDKLKQNQKDAIMAFVQGRNVLCPYPRVNCHITNNIFNILQHVP